VPTPTASPAGLAARLRIVGPTAGAPRSESLAEAVRRGLTARPKSLPCQFFYDAEGSRLFEQICALPEYYPTRTEDAILREHADAMVAGRDDGGLPALIELGSGSSTKTRRLIGALLDRHGRLHYYPIEVSPTILADSARSLVDEFPQIRVTGYADDYREALDGLAKRLEGRPKLVLFLGSSLGNYAPAEAVALLKAIARALGPDDRLLLGTDMVKDRAVLEPAYDDAAGVTAAFNRNLLARINRELGADFDLSAFDHRAAYRDDLERVEMHLVSRADQSVRIPGAGLVARFAEGEAIHTENSHKYTSESLQMLATRSGFVEEAAWSDALGWFRVQRWRPSAGR